MGPPLKSHKQSHSRKQGHATATAPLVENIGFRIYTKQHQRDSGRWANPLSATIEASPALSCGVLACTDALGRSAGRMSSITQFNAGLASWLPFCADAWPFSALRVGVPRWPEILALWDVKKLNDGNAADLAEAMLATNNYAYTVQSSDIFSWPELRHATYLCQRFSCSFWLQ